MGRFQIHDDDDDEDVTTSYQHSDLKSEHDRWEFVTEPERGGALVSRRPHEPLSFRSSYNYSHCLPGRISSNLLHGNDNSESKKSTNCNVYFYSAPHDDEIVVVENRLRTQHLTPSPFSCCSRRSIFLLSLTIALFSWWIHCEGPPAPPRPLSMSTLQPKAVFSSNEDNTDRSDVPVLITWNEFLSKHSLQLVESATALAIHTPLHLLYWWSKWLCAELDGYWNQAKKYWEKNQQSSPQCFYSLNSVFSLHQTFVGQRRAVQAVVNAVQAWKTTFPADDASSRFSQNNSNENDAAPLILYFTGMSSSGKQTLAEQLANVLCAMPVLTITPYNAPQSAALTQQQKVSEQRNDVEWRIRQHVTKYPRSMVVFRDVDEMKDIVQWLGQEFSTTRRSSSLFDDNSKNTLRDICRNNIFVLTSTIAGSRSIARLDASVVMASALLASSNDEKEAKNNDVTDPTLILNIQHEVDQFFGQPVSSWLDAVVPFMPITPAHLAAILRFKVEQHLSSEYVKSSASSFSSALLNNKDTLTLAKSTQAEPWLSLSISDDAVHYLLHPSRVEYLTWKKPGTRSSARYKSKSTIGSDSLTFSTAGASVISDKSALIKQIRTLLHSCLLKQTDAKQVVDEYNGETLIRSMQRAIIDIDSLQNELVLKWCSDDDNNDKANGKLCHSTCRYSMKDKL